MSLRIAFMGAFLIGALSTTLALADTDIVEHYGFDTPTTQQSAFQLYYEHLGVTRHLVQQMPLTNQMMEEIHERSYALKTAASSFVSLGITTNEQASTLLHLIYELHEASEDHDAAKVKQWFAQVDGALPDNIPANSQ